jgi:hypothetical protein
MTVVFAAAAALLAIGAIALVVAPLRRPARPRPTVEPEAIERAAQRAIIVEAARELEHDHRLGNLAAADYQALRARYARQALALARHRTARAKAEAAAARPWRGGGHRSARRWATAGIGVAAVFAAAAAVPHLFALFSSAPAAPAAGAPPGPGVLRQEDRPAAAEDVIEGLVVNGTNGLPVDDHPLALRAVGAAGAASEREATTDGSGRFRFTGLGDAGSVYELAIGHQGVTYRSGALRPGDVRGPVELRVYDATDRDPGLRGDRVVLIIGAVDAWRQELTVHQLMTLTNPSAQTYAPGPAGGMMGLARFALPPGARDLTPTVGLRAEALVVVDGGFATLSAVLPGAQEYGFSYRLPYEPGTSALLLALPYGAAQVRVLAPTDGPDLGGAQLAPADGVTLDGTPFRAWAAGDVAPGGRLTVRLRDLPARPLWVAALRAIARPWAAGAGFAGILLLVLGWTLRGRPAGRRAAPPARLPGAGQAAAEGAS